MPCKLPSLRVWSFQSIFDSSHALKVRSIFYTMNKEWLICAADLSQNRNLYNMPNLDQQLLSNSRLRNFELSCSHLVFKQTNRQVSRFLLTSELKTISEWKYQGCHLKKWEGVSYSMRLNFKDTLFEFKYIHAVYLHISMLI